MTRTACTPKCGGGSSLESSSPVLGHADDYRFETFDVPNNEERKGVQCAPMPPNGSRGDVTRSRRCRATLSHPFQRRGPERRTQLGHLKGETHSV